MTALKAINLEDFRKNCQYAQMYIERQNRLPAEAYKAINIRPPDNPNLNQLVWRHFYKTRSEAARNYKANISDEDLKISPWLRLLSYLMLQKNSQKKLETQTTFHQTGWWNNTWNTKMKKD